MSKYEALGKHIQLVDDRNSENITDRVLGINIDKYFMPSVANVIGTDLSKYKLLKKGYFACNPMHVGRDERLPISLYNEDVPGLVSPAYFMFKVIDNTLLNEEYLMMWFRRPEFDRQCWLRTDGSVRGGITWDEITRMEVPVPSLEKQMEIVQAYRTITDRIALKQRINENLEQQAQAIFANMFDESNTTQATISDVSLNVTDGVHNTVHDDPEGEYLLLSCKNIKGGSLNIGTSERRISRDTFEKLRRRTKLSKGDVLISSVGTIGELLLLNNEPLNYEFQRSVAMVKPNPSVVSSAYLYESLLSNRAKLINSAHGAVQQCLFISDIAEFPIRIPQQDILSEFDTIVTPMLDIVTANENENIKLSQLRDTLLPKLMSGEIDVSDLEF